MDVLYKNGNQELSTQFSLPLKCMVLLKTLELALKKYFFFFFAKQLIIFFDHPIAIKQ